MWGRRALGARGVLGGVFLVLLGILGMHGIGTHGTGLPPMTAMPTMAPAPGSASVRESAAVVRQPGAALRVAMDGQSVHAVHDRSMSMGASCVSLLGGFLVLLVATGVVLRRRLTAFVPARWPRSARADRAPPDLRSLNICRC